MRLIELVEQRLQDLGLTQLEFAHALGIKQNAKAQDFFREMEEDRMKNMVHWRDKIASVLLVPQESVDEAIETSRDRFANRLDAEWRAGFTPHAVLVTEREIPSQISIVAITGADKKRVLNLPNDIPVVAWPEWVQERLPRGLPGFGLVEGFVVNYTPDHAVRFDLEGRPVEILDTAYRAGYAYIRDFSPLFTGEEN